MNIETKEIITLTESAKKRVETCYSPSCFRAFAASCQLCIQKEIMFRIELQDRNAQGGKS